MNELQELQDGVWSLPCR